jgi:hypothetical protein
MNYPIRFRDTDLRVLWKSYESNGSPAMVLVDQEFDEGGDPSPFATATANLPGVQLDEGEVLIKNYSENEGISEALQKAGITEDTGERVESGFIELEVHKIKND